MSLGEDRVRTNFNPSKRSLVDQIKQRSAELIDMCEALKGKDARLAALAQTAYEEAAMWAVKAATAEAGIDPVIKEYPPDHPAPGDLGSVPL